MAFEISGSPSAYLEALSILRWGGTLCLLGIAPRPVTVNFAQQVVLAGITLKGTIGRRIFHTWERVIPLLPAGLLNLLLKSGFNIHTFLLIQFEEAFCLFREGSGIQVLLQLD